MPGYKGKRDAPIFTYDKETLQRLGLKIKFVDDVPATHSRDGVKLVQIFEISDSELSSLLAEHKIKLQTFKKTLRID